MTTLPPPLKAGDYIGVAAPAGYLAEHERFHQGCRLIQDMGFEIFEPEKRWPGYGYLADTDEGRVKELHRLWLQPEVKAIFSLRGGFGSLRLLENLDLDVILAQPKLFIGFSDITVLHNHIVDKTSMMCLHGPGLASLVNCDQTTQERLFHCLKGNWDRNLKENIEIVRAGAPATGILLGGNLSSLVTLLGTPWFPRMNRSILLLEDINEPLYRLDRLLTQLWLSGHMNEIHGVLLGQFSEDSTQPIEQQRRNEFVWTRVAELTESKQVPIWGNLPIGHCRKNLTVPLGIPATMDSDTGILHFIHG